MSADSVAFFYAYLERMPERKREALRLKERFPDQERLLEEFIRFAGTCGFEFSERDFFEFVYKNSEKEEKTLKKY